MLDSGACPGPDPGFAGMTNRGKPRGIKPIEIKRSIILFTSKYTIGGNVLL